MNPSVNLSDDQYEKLWQEAEEYNAEHKVNTIVDAFNEDDYVLSHPYDEVLDPNGDGLMGSIEIPKLNLILAIYHGLSTEVLEKGVGHVEGTSLPIGGGEHTCGACWTSEDFRVQRFLRILTRWRREIFF